LRLDLFRMSSAGCPGRVHGKASMVRLSLKRFLHGSHRDASAGVAVSFWVQGTRGGSLLVPLESRCLLSFWRTSTSTRLLEMFHGSAFHRPILLERIRGTWLLPSLGSMTMDQGHRGIQSPGQPWLGRLLPDARSGGCSQGGPTWFLLKAGVVVFLENINVHRSFRDGGVCRSGCLNRPCLL